MNYLTAIHTDVGIKKKTNQDSCLIMKAKTDIGDVLLAVVCDGMGGLAKGEVASSNVIKAFSNWFENTLPSILGGGNIKNEVFNSWENLVLDMNKKISTYGRSQGISLGTTVASLLFVGSEYFIMNIGDSRVYNFSDKVYQLTKDQTFIQREIDSGRMTPEEAEMSSQRNVLLQCVGAIDYINPDYYVGNVVVGQVYMLCSDGFRHVISEQELYEYLNPNVLVDEQTMKNNAAYLTELNKYRREPDNISVILIKVD